jgi:DNA polymerase-1
MKNYKINPGSNRDVSRVLQELGVELTVRTASGAFALDEEVLTSIIGGPYDEIDFDQLLEGPRLAYYVIARRKVEKMRSTYLESFLGAVDSDGFVHAQINQLGAKTGRMSMERPALQTLPRGRVIRDCFIPREGHSLISADFDGIEMRLLAHFAKDPALIEAIHSGDIHLATAQRVYADNTITKKDPKRQIAKNVGFAKIYGAGVEKIAATAGVSVEAARDFLTSYDSTFPGVKAFQNQVAQIATQRSRQEGVAYVRTPLGRRQVSDGDKDYALVNFLIQGMAADVFKEALVRLAESDIGDYLMLPVHDEIIADVPTEDVEEYMNMLTKIMADDRWEVPLTVGVDGPLSRWGDKYA